MDNYNLFGSSRITDVLATKGISSTNLVRGGSGIQIIEFTYHQYKCKISYTDDGLCTLTINGSYFIMGEQIEVLLTMLNKLLSGEQVEATPRAMEIRSIIFNYQRLF